MKRMLIGCFGYAIADPRPNRFILKFKSLGYSIDLISNDLKAFTAVDNLFQIKNQTSISRLYKLFFLTLRKLVPISFVKNYINTLLYGLKNSNFIDEHAHYQIGICEDIYMMPFFCDLKEQGIIDYLIFDAREYYPDQFEDSWFFKFFERHERQRICREYLKRIDKVLTISKRIAKKYEDEFLIKTTLFISAPKFHDLQPRLNTNSMKLVHHGVANRNRKLENMIEIVNKCPQRVTLDMYLTGDHKYISYLKQIIINQRVKIHPPIQHDLIVNEISNYDIGFFYVEPATFNLENCLPNKLFEFIQARLAVLVGPSPEMVDVVKGYRLGFHSKKFEINSMVNLISSLSQKDIDQAKLNSSAAAKELNFDNQFNKCFGFN